MVRDWSTCSVREGLGMGSCLAWRGDSFGGAPNSNSLLSMGRLSRRGGQALHNSA